MSELMPARVLDFVEKFNESATRNIARAEKQIANLELKTDYMVLDVGCGTGRLAIPIAKQVASVTAADTAHQGRAIRACPAHQAEDAGRTPRS